MSLNQAEKYIRAAELVAGGWAQGFYATDARGNHVLAESPDAKSFCAYGACSRAGIRGINGRRAIREVCEGPKVAAWNDAPGRTKEEVIDLLLAAATLEALS